MFYCNILHCFACFCSFIIGVFELFYCNSRYLALQVRCGLEEFLFRLLVLGCLSDSEGKLWRRNPAHLIAVEALLPDSAMHRQLPKEVCHFWSPVIARLKSF